MSSEEKEPAEAASIMPLEEPPPAAKIVVHITLKGMASDPSQREALKKLVAAGTLTVDHPKLRQPNAVATVDPSISSESLVGLQLQLKQTAAGDGESTAAPEIARLLSDE